MAVAKSLRAILEGSPVDPDHRVVNAELRAKLEEIETQAAAGAIKGFASTVDDLPASGNTLGDLRIVLTDPTVDGGVYIWDGTEWSLDASLPTIYWDDAYARLSQAWAEGTLPGGAGTKSALEHSEDAGAKSLLTAADAVATAADRGAVAADRLLAEAARSDAVLAASIVGPTSVYATKAAATAALGGMSEGDIVDVLVDESRGDTWVRYEVVSAALVFRRTLASEQWVTPEMFGTPGALANDNALLVAAIATGRPVLAFGEVYQFDQLQITDTSLTPCVMFGPNTIVRGVQASGTKYPAIRFEGALQGSAIAVTAFGGEASIGPGAGQIYHTDTITVADASGFSVGDTVYLTETADPIAQDHWPTLPAATDDFNYREFTTIAEIDGNDISFDEFLRWPYDTANDPTLQKVDFMENVRVMGGIYEGGTPVGGGVGLTYCRHSYAEAPMARGLGESSRLGGPPIRWERCWESEEGRVHSRWTLFTHHSVQCQSSKFGKIGGKRTTNGGAILGGDTFCEFDAIVQDSPGDNNGDGMGWSGGFRGNTIKSFILSGARCYGAWIRESCTDNTVLSFRSRAGITGGIYLFGHRNKFLSVDIKGHPSFGLAILGDDNDFPLVDIDVSGTAISITGSGNVVKGRAISRGTDSLARDVLMNVGALGNVVDIIGGARGLNYAGAAQPHYSNDLRVTGPNPYRLSGGVLEDAKAFSYRIIGLTDVAQNLKVPGSGTNGLADLAPPAGDIGVAYKVTLKLNSALADTMSEYVAFGRQGGWSIHTIHEGSGTYAAYVPKLQVSGAALQVVKTNASSINVQVMIQRF